jgi:restriction system protein
VDLSEFPLLNRPALMLLTLKTAGEAPATLQDCMARLKVELARAHEDPPVKPAEIATEMAAIRDELIAAVLLMPAGDGRFTLTARGRDVLSEHPMGVDETVLMRFPEYRTFIRNFARQRTLDDPRPLRYNEGYGAFQSGQGLADNPFAPDTVDHLAWENGWSEARDAAEERRRSRQ